MSGIRSGTRFEQLERVHRQTCQEIAAARRHEQMHQLPRLEELRDRLAAEMDRHRPPSQAPEPTPPTRPPSSEVLRLAELGVTARQVKEWAVAAGLLPAVLRGRVKLELVAAYASAHQGGGL